MNFIGLGIACLALGLSALAEGFAVSKGLESIGRNPSSAKDIRSTMIVGVALIESCAIYILVVAILMAFVV
ncbi:MAG: F0F1 ATP synthase subunit C [Firmicutes bacterium]|uniref:ATP synthase subunit c n=1 Tax=Candidatus Onthovivens merdipullorum TaxID=2840889 RepID=A0A9D9GVT3_9BACL|nr:F0F1 ATP synthase subunit C [Candidatus Onthovivens merdipullorum]